MTGFLGSLKTGRLQYKNLKFEKIWKNENRKNWVINKETGQFTLFIQNLNFE
jgi:hypothetical protein